MIEKSKEETLSSLENKIDNQTKLIDSLLKRVDDLTKVNNLLEKKNKILEERMECLSSSVMEEMEDRNHRRRNVIISGVLEQRSGDTDERRMADMERVEKLMQDLSICVEDNAIRGITRIGKAGKSGHRLLKVTFRDQDIQRDVLRRAKQLRNMDMHRKTFINPDLTLLQRRERKNLNEELRRRRNSGEDVVIWKGKIVKKSQLQNFR